MIVHIQDIKIGDVIKESRGNGFEVEHLNFITCSKGGVHVNRKFCYEWNDLVNRKDVIADDDENRLERDMLEAALSGEIDIPAPGPDSPFSDKATKERLRRQARERAFA